MELRFQHKELEKVTTVHDFTTQIIYIDSPTSALRPIWGHQICRQSMFEMTAPKPGKRGPLFFHVWKQLKWYS